MDRWYIILPCYLLSIYILVLFTEYENDIFEVISYFHVQEYKFGGKINKFGGQIYKFGGKSKQKLNSAEFVEFVFSKSGRHS